MAFQLQGNHLAACWITQGNLILRLHTAVAVAVAVAAAERACRRQVKSFIWAK